MKNSSYLSVPLCNLLLTALVSCSAVASSTPPRQSWVNLNRHSGSASSLPITHTDYQQLAFELQHHRNVAPLALSATAQRFPYDNLSNPRNNLRHMVPLSLIHWHRTIDIVTPEQRRQALDTGMPPETAPTNVTIFAISPVRETTYRGSELKFCLAAEDIFEESVPVDHSIQRLILDAGDGSGPQKLVIGQELSVSYNSIGTKTLSIEATLSDGSILLASAQLEVAALSTPNPTQSVRLIAEYPYNNTTGTIYIYKSGNHTGLRCPVLVAEGFDMENNMDWDVLYNILNTENLAESLRAYGRDLIVLDYTNAMRSIYENAALARAAVTYINARRNNPDDKFTVIGASMGGLVTRIALADMDRYPWTYGASDVDTWISFDSPHTGANIPLSVQEFLKFFYNKHSQFAAAAKLYSALNQPAAKQMLIVHHSKTTQLAGNDEHDTFQAEVNASGYPISCKSVAISNGSGYGYRQPYSEGDLVVYWHYRNWWEVDIDGHLYAISTQSTPSVPVVFYGFWDTLAWFDEVSTQQTHYFTQSLDNAPGGQRASFQELYDSTSSRRGSSDYCLWPYHCFIPTVSSLGIDMAYCTYSLNTYSFIRALSPFDEIHYAVSNEDHIEINNSNKRWFMRAILEGYDTDDDGLDDYQEHLIGTDYALASSKLDVLLSQAEVQDAILHITWNWRPNVEYRIYHAETLAHEWTLVPTGYWYWPGTILPIAGCEFPMTARSGFYKIVANVKDPVTD